jgi:hypothetical protein
MDVEVDGLPGTAKQLQRFDLAAKSARGRYPAGGVERRDRHFGHCVSPIDAGGAATVAATHTPMQDTGTT